MSLITTVLFDLDGTLLPMNQDQFVRGYFSALAQKMSAYGYEPQKLIDSIFRGTAAMIQNDGRVSNERIFWNTFAEIYGERVWADQGYFDEFYQTEFPKIRAFCGFQEKAAEMVRNIKQLG